jgi:hypothetical protein
MIFDPSTAIGAGQVLEVLLFHERPGRTRRARRVRFPSLEARYAQQQITLEYAAEIGCRACATPGGGCQFLGTAATSQVVAEALGLSLPHAPGSSQASRTSRTRRLGAVSLRPCRRGCRNLQDDNDLSSPQDSIHGFKSDLVLQNLSTHTSQVNAERHNPTLPPLI